MQSVALQIGLPGTQELVIVLFIGLFFLAIPVLLVAALVKFLTGNDSETDERIAELEREVEQLREERGTAPGEPDDELE
jgi:membrane protein implicated in regulation of membrane protease activity